MEVALAQKVQRDVVQIQRTDVSDTALICAAVGHKMSTPAITITLTLGNPTEQGLAERLKMAALVLKARPSASRDKASAAMLAVTRPQKNTAMGPITRPSVQKLLLEDALVLKVKRSVVQT